MGDTTIEWTSKTWNPTRGCSIVSPGCTNCYAMGQAHRFSGKGKPFEGLTKKRVKLGVVWTGKVRLAPEMLALPLSWRKPQRVFVNSMSDLFHEELSNEDIAAVFGVMAAAPRHTFQILTKRAKRMREWFDWINTRPVDSGAGGGFFHPFGIIALEANRRGVGVSVESLYVQRGGGPAPWPLPNVWLGVSAEDQQRADERIPELLRTPAAVRFVSYEPALGPVDFRRIGMTTRGDDIDAMTGHVIRYGYKPRSAQESGIDVTSKKELSALDWVICGGESGPRARRFYVQWAKDVIQQGRRTGVKVFVKQLGAYVVHDGIEGAGDWWPNRGTSRAEYDDDGEPAGFRKRLKDKKGGNMAEWPPSLRVREFPDELRT